MIKVLKEITMTKILLGTYTKRISEGIYQIELDTNEQLLKNLNLIERVQNPTYLTYVSDMNTVYSVAQNNDQAGINGYEFDGESTMHLKFSRMETITPPCYVAYDAQEKLIYDANYHKGKVMITREDGTLDKVIQYAQGAKAHFMDVDPKTGDVYVCDLGLDTVHKYRLLNEIATYKTETGTGPRHIAFHPSLPILYVFGELSSTITVLKDEEFELRKLQEISTLPEKQETNWGAAIKISRDGKFIYASNRADNTLSVLAVNEQGLLELVQNISTYGDHPRDFDLSKDDSYLVCANMQSDTLTLYSRDEKTGMLSLIQKDVFAPEVVCVKFI